MHVEENEHREELMEVFTEIRAKVHKAFLPYWLELNDIRTRDGIIGAMSRTLECYVKDTTTCQKQK